MPIDRALIDRLIREGGGSDANAFFSVDRMRNAGAPGLAETDRYAEGRLLGNVAPLATAGYEWLAKPVLSLLAKTPAAGAIPEGFRPDSTSAPLFSGSLDRIRASALGAAEGGRVIPEHVSRYWRDLASTVHGMFGRSSKE